MMQNAPVGLELRDIHLPTEPSMWPLAPAWWVLIVLVVLLIFVSLKLIKKIKQRKQLNDLMQQELNTINNNYKKHNNKPQLAADISQLLKRFVLFVLKDKQAISLTGQPWIDYLNEQVHGDDFDVHHEALTVAQYNQECDFDVPSIIATVKNYFPKAIKMQAKQPKGKKHA